MLPFGTFYGMVERRIAESGMEFALLDVDPHRVVERHSHEEAHVVFVLDGLYVSSAVGAPPVSDGPALIFNPAGTTHRDRFEARGRTMAGQFLTISLAASFLHTAEQDGALALRSIALDAPGALMTARRLVEACVSRDRGSALRRETLTAELLGLVATTTPAEKCLGAPQWLRTARQRLDDALGEPPSLTEVARACGVHPVHLARVFRQYVGVSPSDYHRTRRLLHARSLLQGTQRSLSDIALHCGFADQAHFTHAFRRAFGVTPHAYRASA